MIRTYFRLYDIHLFPFAQLPQNFSYLSAFFATSYLPFHFVSANLFVSFIPIE